MTANKDLKKLIRDRTRKTGESYAAARRHFLKSEEANMTTHEARQDQSALRSSIRRLELTLKTTRALEQHGIGTIGQLVGKPDSELTEIGLSDQSRIEIREVLASRGL